MDYVEAANHYLYLVANGDLGAAIRFALDYEDGASDEDFDRYLGALDAMRGEG